MRYLSAQEQPDIDGQKERTRDMIVAFLMGRKGSKVFPERIYTRCSANLLPIILCKQPGIAAKSIRRILLLTMKIDAAGQAKQHSSDQAAGQVMH